MNDHLDNNIIEDVNIIENNDVNNPYYSDYPEHGIPEIDITDPEYANCIINNARVDFGNNRIVQEHIKIVQYDENLRIVVVELYVNGFEYIIPDYIFQNGRMQIRWGNPDHTFIDDLVLGFDRERNTVYFMVDKRMTY